MKITTIGIDLAKEVFQIHGVDMHGKAVLRKRLRRSEMVRFFVNLEPCLIGMEACGSSSHWGYNARKFVPQWRKLRKHCLHSMIMTTLSTQHTSAVEEMAATRAIRQKILAVPIEPPPLFS